MERILVIGSPGSGKSTFSRALAQRKQLPLVYLDQLFWNADRTRILRAQCPGSVCSTLSMLRILEITLS